MFDLVVGSAKEQLQDWHVSFSVIAKLEQILASNDVSPKKPPNTAGDRDV